MFDQVSLEQVLRSTRKRIRKSEDQLLVEANKILTEDLFSEEKVLENLTRYNHSFELMSERDCEQENLYTLLEIKEVAVKYRLRFLDSAEHKMDFPYEAILKTKDLNRRFSKELKAFKVLAEAGAFKQQGNSFSYSLFVRTNGDNYYLIHSWGEKIRKSRKIKYWFLQSFERLVASIFIFTLCVTLCLPTQLITLDHSADYWSGYRGGVLFHLMFFFSGFTAYFLLAFAVPLSNTSWDRK